MKKKLLYVLLAVVVVLVVFVGWFVLRFRRMAQVMTQAPTASVDLSRLADGNYTGTFGDFLVTAKVRVKVASGRITSVEVLDQHAGPGYEAKDIPARIVAAQSPNVDVVTGATGSSRCLMAAVHRALNSPPDK
jgi:uncharacterized protein with FMN-binding domain